MPPKKKVPTNFAAVQRKRHQAQAPAQQEQQVDLDVEMPDVVGPGESMAGPLVHCRSSCNFQEKSFRYEKFEVVGTAVISSTKAVDFCNKKKMSNF